MTDIFFKSDTGDVFVGCWDGLKNHCVICLSNTGDIPTIKSALVPPYGIIWNPIERAEFERAFMVAQAGQREILMQEKEYPEVSPIEGAGI